MNIIPAFDKVNTLIWCLTMRQILIILSILFFYLNASGQRLERFAGKDASGKMYGYPHIKNYFGYLDETMAPDSLSSEGRYFFLYFTTMDTVSDIGIRIVNPVPTMCMPDKGDVVANNYYEHEQEKSGRFKSKLALEYKKEGSWETVALSNGKDGSANTIRIHDNSHVVIPGNYRISVFAPKEEKLIGGFLIQVGSFSNIKSLLLTE